METYCNILLPDGGIDPGSVQWSVLCLSLEKFVIIQGQHCSHEDGKIWKVLYIVQCLRWCNSP